MRSKIKNPRDRGKYYVIELDVSSEDIMFIYRQDGEGMVIHEVDFYEILHAWFEKKMKKDKDKVYFNHENYRLG